MTTCIIEPTDALKIQPSIFSETAEIAAQINTASPQQPIAEEIIIDDHLRKIDEIIAKTQQEGRTLKLMFLDIDDTLLYYDEDSDTFNIKCLDAWLKRMATERARDMIDNTFTVWGIATSRTKIGGIYEAREDEEKISLPEIQLFRETFLEYLNSNLFCCTGGENPDGTAGCKVDSILKYFHETYGVPKADIMLFDDNPFTIHKAKDAGYNTLLIPINQQEARFVIEKGRKKNAWEKTGLFRSHSLGNLATLENGNESLEKAVSTPHLTSI